MRITYTDELGITRCRLCRSKRCARIPALSRSRSYTPCDPAKRDKRSLRSRNQLAPRASRADREWINRCNRDGRRSAVRLAGMAGRLSRQVAADLGKERRYQLPPSARLYQTTLRANHARLALEEARIMGLRLTRSQLAALRALAKGARPRG